MSRNNGYLRGNVSDFSFYKNCYKLIGIDLSRKINKITPQQDDDAGMIFIAKKSIHQTSKNYSKFFFRFINCNSII